MVDSQTADSGEAAANPEPAAAPAGRPSLWSAVWVGLAFFYLVFARASFSRLGS
jgi:hypothetical protein